MGTVTPTSWAAGNGRGLLSTGTGTRVGVQDTDGVLYSLKFAFVLKGPCSMITSSLRPSRQGVETVGWIRSSVQNWEEVGGGTGTGTDTASRSFPLLRGLSTKLPFLSDGEHSAPWKPELRTLFTIC